MNRVVGHLFGRSAQLVQGRLRLLHSVIRSDSLVVSMGLRIAFAQGNADKGLPCSADRIPRYAEKILCFSKIIPFQSSREFRQ